MTFDVLTLITLFAVGLLFLWFIISRKWKAYTKQNSDSLDSSKIYHTIHSSDEEVSGSKLLHPYGVAWTQGRRAYMEDRYTASEVFLSVGAEGSSRKKRAAIYGIFDGHGGYRAAEFCKNNTQKLFENCQQNMTLTSRTGDQSDGDIAAQILHQTMCSLDTEFLKTARASNLADGTTAIVAFAHGDQLVVGNIGMWTLTSIAFGLPIYMSD